MKTERFIGFTLNGKEFAMNLLEVRSVDEFIEPTPAYEVLPHVEGVVDIRDDKITVVNLKKKLGMKDYEIKGKEKFIVIESLDDKLIGVLTDDTNNILEISEDEISETALLDETIENKHVIGVWKNEKDELVTIVDVRNLVIQ